MYYNKYSVLMSVYYKENPEFLKASIESMLNQSLLPDEFVIVKDGKLTKGLDKVINFYKTKYFNLFKIVSLEKNIGLGLALNEGLKICRNEIVARMDSDDIALSRRCELQIKEFNKNTDLSICGTMINEFYGDPNKIVSSRSVPLNHQDILKFSRRRSPFNHPTVMYKKIDVLKTDGGYHDINRKEDIDLFARMLNQGCIAMNIDEPLLLFRSNEDNFKRRKSWSNCKSYIMVIYNLWKKNYSTTFDLIYVTLGQIITLISPIWMFKIISSIFLRKNY